MNLTQLLYIFHYLVLSNSLLLVDYKTNAKKIKLSIAINGVAICVFGLLLLWLRFSPIDYVSQSWEILHDIRLWLYFVTSAHVLLGGYSWWKYTRAPQQK